MIDLERLARDLGYRTSLDPSADIDGSRESRPWLIRIPCAAGFIAPHGPELLSAYCNRPRQFSSLLALAGARVFQRGDRELRAIFPCDRLEAVAQVLQARRRRRLSPEAREAAVARLERTRFRPLSEAIPGPPERSQAPA